MPEEDRVADFTTGLQPHIRTQVRMFEPTTLAEEVKRAKTAEEISRDKRRAMKNHMAWPGEEEQPEPEQEPEEGEAPARWPARGKAQGRARPWARTKSAPCGEQPPAEAEWTHRESRGRARLEDIKQTVAQGAELSRTLIHIVIHPWVSSTGIEILNLKRGRNLHIPTKLPRFNLPHSLISPNPG